MCIYELDEDLRCIESLNRTTDEDRRHAKTRRGIESALEDIELKRQITDEFFGDE